MNAYRPVLSPHRWKELAMDLRNSGSALSLEQAATLAIRAWIVDNPSELPPPPAATPDQVCGSAPERAVAAKPATHMAQPPSEPPSAEGYQWKGLFLPSGTDLRMSTREGTGRARVCGDHIMYQGRRVSPRGLTLAIAGGGRNAWRDLWLRMPGEIDVKLASECRHEHERMNAGLPPHAWQRPNTANMEHTTVAAPNAPIAERAAQAPPRLPAEHDAAHAAAADQASTVAAAAVAMSESLKTMLALMERMCNNATPRATPDDERRIQHGRRAEDILADQWALD